MLTSYALLHAPPRPNRSTCTLADGGRPGRLTHAAAARPPLRTLTLTLTLALTLTPTLTVALTLALTLTLNLSLTLTLTLILTPTLTLTLTLTLSRPMEMDDLASSTSEQWRLRVGRLWGMPYQEHPPERLQTADARLVSRSGWPGRPSSREIDAALFAPAERPAAAASVATSRHAPPPPPVAVMCAAAARGARLRWWVPAWRCLPGGCLQGACGPVARPRWWPRCAGGVWVQRVGCGVRGVQRVGCWSCAIRVATSAALLPRRPPRARPSSRASPTSTRCPTLQRASAACPATRWTWLGLGLGLGLG